MITVHDKTYRKRIEEIKYYKEMYEFEVERNIKLLDDSKDLITQINYYMEKNKILKQRIDKAIEYIEKGQEKTMNNLINGISKVEIISFQHIIDILKGSDKE